MCNRLDELEARNKSLHTEITTLKQKDTEVGENLKSFFPDKETREHVKVLREAVPSFDGQSAKGASVFLRCLTRFFPVSRLSLEQQVEFIEARLIEDAAYWFDSLLSQLSSVQHDPGVLLTEIKVKFLPVDLNGYHIQLLMCVRQKGLLAEYAREFSDSCAIIQDLSEEFEIAVSLEIMQSDLAKLVETNSENLQKFDRVLNTAYRLSRDEKHSSKRSEERALLSFQLKLIVY